MAQDMHKKFGLQMRLGFAQQLLQFICHCTAASDQRQSPPFTATFNLYGILARLPLAAQYHCSPRSNQRPKRQCQQYLRPFNQKQRTHSPRQTIPSKWLTQTRDQQNSEWAPTPTESHRDEHNRPQTTLPSIHPRCTSTQCSSQGML